jgi:hypothetical protein
MDMTKKPMLQRYVEQLQNVDELTLVILKGHLLVEEMLTRILETFVFHPEHLEKCNLRFAQKVELARSVSLDEHQNPMWKLVIALNTLRNELAHSLDSPKRQSKIDALMSTYFEVNSGMEGIEEHKKLEDKIVAAFAIALCLGFLSTFEQEVQRFRAVVNTLDKIVNPHRHQSAEEAKD